MGSASIPEHLGEHIDLLVGLSEFLTPKQESIRYFRSIHDIYISIYILCIVHRMILFSFFEIWVKYSIPSSYFLPLLLFILSICDIYSSYSLIGNTETKTKKVFQRNDIVVTPSVLKNYYQVPLCKYLPKSNCLFPLSTSLASLLFCLFACHSFVHFI